MKAARFFLAPVFAIFDLNVYREARNEKFGTAVLYQLYLSALFCVAVAVLSVSLLPKADAFMDWLKKECPGMTFTAQGLKLDTPGKVTLTHPTLGSFISFDDSRQTMTEEEMGQSMIYVTSTMIYTRTGRGLQARSFVGAGGNAANAPAQKNVQIHLDGVKINEFYTKLKWPLVVVFMLILLCFGFISRLLTALILGVFGFLIQLAVPRGLQYENFFVLASFSLSLGLIFGVFQYVPVIGRFFPSGVGLILSIVYFGIGIAVQPKATAE